ncbi:MAG: SCP2 sterol-binding domain-containing protein, partial [Promethearchaeota archaeon]
MSDRKIRVPFPSKIWMETYMNMLNESKEYETSAKTWEGSMLFVIKAKGELTPIDLHFWFDLWHGKCRDYKMVYSKDMIEADFIFEGPENNWIQMLEGKIEAIKGLMAGKFRLTGGNMTPVMRHVKAAQILVEILQEFEFDYVKTEQDPEKDDVLRF